MIDFDDWCYHAVAQIRFKPDRQAVFDELKAHLEDHYENLLTQGYSLDEARRLALEAMGSADDIAPQLGQIHKPWLGYLYRVVKRITVPASILALFLLVSFYGSQIHALISTANYDSLRDKGGFYCQPNVKDSSDGYQFKITEAAVNTEGDTLYLVLQTTYLPWLPEPAIANYFHAVDSLGNTYASRWEVKYDDVPKVSYQGGFYTQGFGASNLKITHFDSRAQWVDLRYERDGRYIVLRIDLTGGEES